MATVMARSAHEVRLWGLAEDGIEAMAKLRENKRFLPGVKLDEPIHPLLDMQSALEDAEVVFCSVPSQAVRVVLEQARPYIGSQSFLVNTAKGLELSSGKRMSQVFSDVLGEDRIKQYYGVLSGPSHAEEVGRNLPTLVTLAAYKNMTAFEIQNYFTAQMFRVYTTFDVPGVEMGGTFKNIVALAAGGIDGLGYGDNSIAALITRGLTEMIRFGTALGGDSRTFTGLSGLGDMVVTATSKYSRNRRAGGLMVRNMKVEAIRKSVNMEVEGINATKIVYEVARRMDIDMPICKAMYAILYKNGNPTEAVGNLMMRRQKNEIDGW
jgi:glycerol-3-phosphate dehydrogenase (NAD(P)+)